MADRNDPCGCDESLKLREQLREREEECCKHISTIAELYDALGAARAASERHEQAYQREYRKHGELLAMLGEFFPGGADVREVLTRQRDDLAELRAGRGSWCPSCKGHLLGGDHFAGRACGTCHGETINLVDALAEQSIQTDEAQEEIKRLQGWQEQALEQEAALAEARAENERLRSIFGSLRDAWLQTWKERGPQGKKEITPGFVEFLDKVDLAIKTAILKDGTPVCASGDRVCRWTPYRHSHDTYKTGCGKANAADRYGDYCQYCGGKIEIVADKKEG